MSEYSIEGSSQEEEEVEVAENKYIAPSYEEDHQASLNSSYDAMITVKFIIPPKNRVFTNSYQAQLPMTEVLIFHIYI